jgi:hypothetical protein
MSIVAKMSPIEPGQITLIPSTTSANLTKNMCQNYSICSGKGNTISGRQRHRSINNCPVNKPSNFLSRKVIFKKKSNKIGLLENDKIIAFNQVSFNHQIEEVGF